MKGDLSLSFFIHYNEDRQMEEFDDSEDLHITGGSMDVDIDVDKVMR